MQICMFKPAKHLSPNMWKWAQNVKNKKCISGYFAPLFSYFVALFSLFVPESAFVRKLQGFCGLFFQGINKTRNSHEIRKVYSQCFVFRCVFCPKDARSAKCIAASKPTTHYLSLFVSKETTFLWKKYFVFVMKTA